MCRPSVFADIVHVQGCMKDSEVVKANVALVCFVLFGIKTEMLYMGKTNKLNQADMLRNLHPIRLLCVFVGSEGGVSWHDHDW